MAYRTYGNMGHDARVPAFLDDAVALMEAFRTEFHNTTRDLGERDVALVKVTHRAEGHASGLVSAAKTSQAGSNASGAGTAAVGSAAGAAPGGSAKKVASSLGVALQSVEISKSGHSPASGSGPASAPTKELAEKLKKSLAELSALEKQGMDLSAKKTAIVQQCTARLDGYMRSLEDSMFQFEEYLRRENRWPDEEHANGNKGFAPSPSASPRARPKGVTTHNAPNQRPANASALQGDAGNTVVIIDNNLALDPDEPRYCMCNQVSYGEMVACENENCPYEWFHYQCVGLSAPPKGRWRCAECKSGKQRS
ncbi:Inhibitor of growth protein 3 [Porphyridium purpureum]|uniref:Inhibitor of growth protein 3 n=1 Tax=Porphyridium purpureum TaxID=35688 RepID=A0A5J4YZH1_PORPP|nr:Inhibitor of growth protein 3 [Porphyridium purpureum]|eukprot:POR5447..scf208_2